MNGLDDLSPLPMRVQLVNDRGRVLRAGRIDALDVNGSRRLPPVPDVQGLGGFTTVNVADLRAAAWS